MFEAELREVIDNPAFLTGCHPQEGLRELLLGEVRGETGSLPLLEFTLDELWKRRDANDRLTVKAYQEIGGVQGALRQHAEEVYSELARSEEKGEICRRVLVDLVHLGEGTRDIKRRLPFKRLRGAHGPDAPLIREVLDVLQEARLVTTSQDDSLYEVAHEALIRGWPRLLEWLEVQRDSELIRRQLEDAAEEWVKRGRDEGYFHRGSRLARASCWASEHPGDVTPLVREFLEACHAHSRREEESKLAARLSDHRARIASAQRLAAHSLALGGWQAPLGLLLAVEAVRAIPEEMGPAVRAAETALHRSVQLIGGPQIRGHEDAINAMGFARDGRLVTAGDDGTVRVWDLNSRNSDPVVLRGHKGYINTLGFARDGRLVTAGSDGTARVWELNSRNSDPVVLRGHEGRINALCFAPDGQLVTAGNDGTARVWDVNSPTCSLERLRGHQGFIEALGFARDGRLVTAGYDRIARVWDLSSPQSEPVALRGHEGWIFALGFAPDGRLVTAGEDCTARIWDLDSPGSSPIVLCGDAGSIRALGFAADGRLVTAGHSNTATVWNLRSPHSAALELRGHEGWINALGFARDGRLVTAGEDGTARVWELNSQNSDPVVLRRHSRAIYALHFAPDGRLVTGGQDGTVRVWTLDVPSLLKLAANSAPRNLTLEEWQRHFPGEPYRPTFPALGSPA